MVRVAILLSPRWLWCCAIHAHLTHLLRQSTKILLLRLAVRAIHLRPGVAEVVVKTYFQSLL